jgi:hypothetical protein
LFETIAKDYQFYVFVFSMFVIFMGIARWFGKRTWLDREKAARSRLKLPVAQLSAVGGDLQQSFTYAGLFQGGLVGVVAFVILMMYVVVMTAMSVWSSGDAAMSQSRVLAPVPVLMLFPIVMIPWAIFQYVRMGRKASSGGVSRPKLIWIVVFVCWIAYGVVVYLMVAKALTPGEAVACQLLTTAILLLCLSYSIGMMEGLKAADPAANCPLVNVKVIEGSDLDGAWLYETTDTDYRLVAADGSNHIIPSTNVKAIQGPIAQ